MLGPAELREIQEALDEHHTGAKRTEVSSSYLSPHFAVGLAVTRAATATGLKMGLPHFSFKR